jgi:hypothetical protein
MLLHFKNSCYNNLSTSTLCLFCIPVYNCSHSAFEAVLQALNIAKLNLKMLLYVSCIDTVAHVTVYIGFLARIQHFLSYEVLFKMRCL